MQNKPLFWILLVVVIVLMLYIVSRHFRPQTAQQLPQLQTSELMDGSTQPLSSMQIQLRTSGNKSDPTADTRSLEGQLLDIDSQ